MCISIGVPNNSDSSNSSDSGAIIGGVVGGIMLLLMITVVLCIVILCMRRSHRKKGSHIVDNATNILNTNVTIDHNPSYDVTIDDHNPSYDATIDDHNPSYDATIDHDPSYDVTIDHNPSYAVTIDHTPSYDVTKANTVHMDHSYDTINPRDLDLPITTNPSCNVHTKSYSKTSEDEYIYAQLNELIQHSELGGYENYPTVDQSHGIRGVHSHPTANTPTEDEQVIYGVVNQPRS